MRVVALVSGGKDSCYNAMQCIAAGHTLVALANLQPEGKDELDSFMFQTVGHEAVELFAEAMGLPLYRAVTRGECKGPQALEYTPHQGDEVEDLYDLLLRVQATEGVEGVASGAVLSDYQRLRVEHVCGRLGMTSLAYLWRRNQTELLAEMISTGISAILIKVAAIGLSERHLGCTLQEVEPHLLQLHRLYGVHVCGEGGEYETFTVDCPLFSHRIVIDQSEVRLVTSDDLAPVAYLQLSQLHLERKPPCLQKPLPPPPETKVLVPPEAARCQVVHCAAGGNGSGKNVWRWRVFEGKGEGISEQTYCVFSELSDWLEVHERKWTDVAIVHLYLSDMDNFSLVNSIYCTFFPSRPPARVCVQLTLPIGIFLRMEVLLLCKEGEGEGLVTMHVQSLSHWAPANIGPYSQAVKGGKVVFTSGQIGLHPSTMALALPLNQPSLSLTHVTSVLEALQACLGSALCGVCYFTTEEAGWAARTTWTEHLEQLGGRGPALVFLKVPALPRGACVEWTFTALTLPCQPQHQSLCEVVEGVGMVTVEEVKWCGGGCVSGDPPIVGAWLVTLSKPWTTFLLILMECCVQWATGHPRHSPSPLAPPPVPLASMCDAVKLCIQRLSQQLSVAGASIDDISQLQFFLPRYSSGSPLSSEDLSVMSGGGVVTVTPCEGYFGQNCSISLLALLLSPSPSLLAHDNTSY